MLSRVGIQGPAWLLSPDWVIPAFAIMSVWGAGGLMIIYLAALQGIPDELYEAARLDGANAAQQLRHITIPMLSPTILFNIVTGIIAVFQTFTSSWIITKGGPNYATYFYVLHIYNTAFSGSRMGYASALAWILFLLVLVLTMAVIRSSSYWVFYAGEKEDR
jgi:multiple sugar transport system permease protein